MLLFAENLSPLLGLLIIMPVVMTIASRVAIISLKRRRGQRPWWGLAIGSLSILIGIALVFMFLTTRGGAPTFFYLFAGLPILAGAGCLMIWFQPPRDVF
jgi:uncharacterized membrane protein HdeD (DUF308 family)